MHTSFRRLLGAIILIATVGGAAMLALRAEAHPVANELAGNTATTQLAVSESHG